MAVASDNDARISTKSHCRLAMRGLCKSLVSERDTTYCDLQSSSIALYAGTVDARLVSIWFPNSLVLFDRVSSVPVRTHMILKEKGKDKDLIIVVNFYGKAA